MTEESKINESKINEDNNIKHDDLGSSSSVNNDPDNSSAVNSSIINSSSTNFNQELPEDDDVAFDFTSTKNKFRGLFAAAKRSVKTHIDTQTENKIPDQVVDQNSDKNMKIDSSMSSSTKDDDSIDLTKIKEKILTIFKKDKRAEKEIHKKSYDEEVSSDKNIGVKDDDISFDYQKTVKFAKKHSKLLIPIFFILIAIFVSSYFRMMPSDLPITDNWADDAIRRFYGQQLEKQITNQYPNLPVQNREIILNQELEKAFNENKDQIARDKKQLSAQYKANFQDENGNTYLLAIDPYLWYSQARNVINNGYLGDKKIDGISYFSLRDGRLDKKSSVQLHPYIAAYLFKFLHFFDSNITLMRALFLLPVIIIGLSLIPVFFIGRKFGGNVGGLFAAIFLAINGPLLGRTPAGFADTDPYNIFWPLLITWFFLEAYDAKTSAKNLLFGSLAGFSIGLYAATWSGWSSTFVLLLGLILILIIYKFIIYFIKTKKLVGFTDKKFNHLFKTGAIFFVSSGIFVSLFESFFTFKNSFSRLTKFITLKSVGVKSIWPNVLTTVAEFNTQGFSNIINQMGGKLLFFVCLLGILFLLNKKIDKRGGYFLFVSLIYYFIILNLDLINEPVIFLILITLPVIVRVIMSLYYKDKINLIYPLTLMLWLVSTAYAFTKGIRFAILLAPPFAIGIDSSFGFFYNNFSNWVTNGINLNKKLSKTIIFIVLCLFLITPLTNAERIARSEIPSMNDAWYNTLTKIKDNTTDAIITSWWDFGHWFVAIAERRVTFDGGDQGKRIHWVGRTLRTDSEEEAIGILRMLNCVQETAPEKLDEFTSDSLKSVNILYEIFPISDRTLALEKYQDLGLTKDQAMIMIEYTHCKDLIPNFYITSQDMVGKAGVWGHFGSWDFTKATMYQNTKKLSNKDAVKYLMGNFDLDETAANNVYTDVKTKDADRWIAPWPGYLTGLNGCSREDSKLLCNANLQGNQFIIEVTANTAKIKGTEVVPNSLVYVTPEGISEQELEGDKAGFSLVLIPKEDGYNFILTDPLQAGGMFTRLFYLEAHGLKCFRKFDDVVDPTNQRIITWEVDFGCMQDNKVYFNDKSVTDNLEDTGNNITSNN